MNSNCTASHKHEYYYPLWLEQGKMKPMINIKGVSTDDQQTWELTKKSQWRSILPVILFTFGILFVVILFIVESL